MRKDLKVQLILSYILISVILVLSLYFVSIYFFQKQFQNYIIKQQEIKNQEIVQIITNAYSKDGKVPDINFFEEYGETLLEQYIILSVYNENDVQVFCMACVQKDNCSHTINGMKQMMKNIYPNFKGNYVEKKLDIVKNGKKLGYVNIGYFGPFFYSESDQHFIKNFNSVFILIAILSLLVSIVLGLITANKISNPIKKVINKTKNISNGDYSGKIDIRKKYNKEIIELANSVNNLASNLKNQLAIKKQMAGDFSHEFLTPLTTIQGNIEAMIDGVFEPTKERLENLKSEVQRLSRMVYEIDKIVAITNERSELNKINFDLTELINNTLQNFETELYNKKINLNFNNNKCDVFADKDKINQVIINLISNAIKYTQESGNISISLKQTKKNTIIVVEDSGIGIDKADLPYIFEYLYRVDKCRCRNTGGSGIGLYVVKNIIDSHNGEIEVNSKLGVGTKFTIILPNK